MWLIPAEPCLFQTNEKSTEKEKKYRNVSHEITTIVATLAENSVFMKDIVAYSEKLIEEMIFRATFTNTFNTIIVEILWLT